MLTATSRAVLEGFAAEIFRLCRLAEERERAAMLELCARLPVFMFRPSGAVIVAGGREIPVTWL